MYYVYACFKLVGQANTLEGAKEIAEKHSMLHSPEMVWIEKDRRILQDY